MYRILQSIYEPGSVAADLVPPKDFTSSWIRGAVFQTPPPNPLVLSWDPDHEGGVRLPFYSAGTVLMHHELVAGLTNAGVDNLDAYPCIIRSQSGKPDCKDYVAVNVLGIVDAIDHENSIIVGDDPDDLFFEGLAIDPEKARGLLLFRLKGAENLVVVNENLVTRLIASSSPVLQGIEFLDPANYSG
jgi:hypothetical protein